MNNNMMLIIPDFIGNKKSNTKSSSEAETKTSKSKLKEEKEKEVDVNSNVPLPVPVQSTDVAVITNRNPSIPRVEVCYVFFFQ